MSHLALIDYKTYLMILICAGVGLFIAAAALGLSYLIAIQAPDPEKTSPYECGFEPFNDARNKFDVRFYIVAILFLIFDLEVAILFPWAGTIGLTGILGYTTVIIFLILLTVGFVYEVAKGALNLQ